MPTEAQLLAAVTLALASWFFSRTPPTASWLGPWAKINGCGRWATIGMWAATITLLTGKKATIPEQRLFEGKIRQGGVGWGLIMVVPSSNFGR